MLQFVGNGTDVNGIFNGVGSEQQLVHYTAMQKLLEIGSRMLTPQLFMDHISRLRIYKGVAKYTATFVPAATNSDILPDSPSGVATKSKLKRLLMVL